MISFECNFFDLDFPIACASHFPGRWCNCRVYMKGNFPINHSYVCIHVRVCLFLSLHLDVLAYVALTATQPIPPSGEGMPKGSPSAMPAGCTWSSMGWEALLKWEEPFGCWHHCIAGPGCQVWRHQPLDWTQKSHNPVLSPRTVKSSVYWGCPE